MGKRTAPTSHETLEQLIKTIQITKWFHELLQKVFMNEKKIQFYTILPQLFFFIKLSLTIY